MNGTMNGTIRFQPGALARIPVAELAQFLAAYGLELVHKPDGLLIRKAAPQTFKGICFAPPCSLLADTLGHVATGCYYLYTREEGRGDTRRISRAYQRPDDPELLEQYLAHPADLCPDFQQHARPEIKAAIKAAVKAAKAEPCECGYYDISRHHSRVGGGICKHSPR